MFPGVGDKLPRPGYLHPVSLGGNFSATVFWPQSLSINQITVIPILKKKYKISMFLGYKISTK